jgi:ABC-type branched-subunit amino acid transport system substrate-binding protein
LKLPLINVGITDNVGSPVGSHPGAPAVVVASARALNRGGGLHGHPLGVVFCNNQSDPNMSQSCARQFVADNVVALLGGNDNNDALSEPILQAGNIPTIAMTPNSPVMYTAPNVFVPQAPPLYSYEATVGYAFHKGLGPVVPGITDVSGGHNYLQIVQTAAQAAGVAMSNPVFISPSAVDFTPYAAAVDQESPGSVFCVCGFRLWGGLLQSLTADGSRVKALLTSPTFALSDVQPYGSLVDKVITFQTIPPYNDPRMAVVLKQLAAEQARGDQAVALDKITPDNIDGWIALQILMKITSGMKQITGTNIINALHKSGPIKVAPFLTWNPQTQGPAGYTNLSNTTGYFVGYKNGQQELLVNRPVTVAQALAGKF